MFLEFRIPRPRHRRARSLPSPDSYPVSVRPRLHVFPSFGSVTFDAESPPVIRLVVAAVDQRLGVVELGKSETQLRRAQRALAALREHDLGAAFLRECAAVDHGPNIAETGIQITPNAKESPRSDKTCCHRGSVMCMGAPTLRLGVERP